MEEKINIRQDTVNGTTVSATDDVEQLDVTFDQHNVSRLTVKLRNKTTN
jgi:hypothetical protein